MKTRFAIKKAGGRDELARLLGVEVITTYHWKRVLPEKHDRYLRVLKPTWFQLEHEEQQQQQPALASPGGS